MALALVSSVATFAVAQPAPGNGSDRVSVKDPDYVNYTLRKMFQDNWVGGEADVGSDQPNRIRIEYASPKNPEHQMLYDRLRENRALETVQGIFSPFRLPVDLLVRTQPCDGLANSWYDTEGPGPTVHMCYELLQHILDTAPKETTPARITPRDAIVGQFMFFTSNEIGHALFDIFKVPVFGDQEFSADQFATYVMLQFGKERARGLIGGAVYAVNALVKDYKENPVVQKRMEKFADIHGLPEQRFYNILCLAYGADPKTFPDLEAILTKRRAGNCEYEYQDLVGAWRSSMMPHIDRQLAKQVLDTTWLPPTRQLAPK
jgi:hypothetical protein